MAALASSLADLRAGFADPPRQSQQVFRAAMQAMARPGTVHDLPIGLAPPEDIAPAAAALLLTLLDGATRIWVPDRSRTVRDWLRFHTGAEPVGETSLADFAWAADPAELPPLEAFAFGSDAFPDRSTTLVLQLDALDAGDDATAAAGGEAPGRAALRLQGPGIPGTRRLHAAPMPAGFVVQWQAMRGRFPRGLDVYLCAGERLAALPRSTNVEAC